MFKIIISTRAQKDLKRIYSTPYYQKIKKALLEMKDNPFLGNVKPLRAFPYADYRKRVGTYRILFDILLEDKTIRVYRIRHRKDIYRS